MVPGDEFFFAVWLRAGIAMPTDINVAGQLWRVAVTLVEPHLHTDLAVGRVGLREAVVDVRPQRL